jgi:arsenite methyltransferase
LTEYLGYKNDFDSPGLALVCDELSFWSSRFGRVLFEQVGLRRDQSILDVGCANGFPLFELAHVFGRSCRVTGLDIWTQALLRAREKLRFYDLPNVQLVLADGARQPFADRTFDLIVSNLGLNNWSQPQGVLAECFRVSKPAARIALTTNVLGHYKEFYAIFREVLRERGRPEYLARLEAQEAHRGTRESHCALLAAAGFKLVKVIEESFELRFLDAGALMNHSLTKIGFLDGWRSVVERDEEREIFETVERKLDDTSSRRGELRLSVPVLYLEAEKAT